MIPQSLDEFLNWKPVYPDAIIGKGLLYTQTRMFIYGKYKALKSMSAVNMGLCVAAGVPWIGFETMPEGARVLYLQLEVPHPLLHKRISRMWRTFSLTYGIDTEKTRQNLFLWTEPFLKLDRPEGIGTLKQYIEVIKPAVVIIDPVYKLLSGNILDPNSVRALCDSVDILLSTHECAIVLVHHARKGAMEEDVEWDSDDMLGAAVFSYWADTVAKVQRVGERNNRVALKYTFDVVRHAEEGIDAKEVIFDRETLSFSMMEEALSLG